MGDWPKQWLTPVVGPSVWTAAELCRERSWVHRLTDIEFGELREATLGVRSRGREPRQLTRAEFALPTLGATIMRIREQLVTGRGLFLLGGLRVEDYSVDDLVALCSGLAVQLNGALVPQNFAGDRFRFVTDCGKRKTLDEHQARGHRGCAEMLPHSDSSEIAGLLCVRSAKRGGSTSVCSSGAVYNGILGRSAQHLVPLQEGFYFDLTGKTEAGVSRSRLPVFALRDGQLTCRFNRSRIEMGMHKAGVALSSAESAALECVSDLARSPDLAMYFRLQPGDVLFLNNGRVLHARDAYEDWPQPHRKRLLIRFWLQMQ